MNNTQQRLKELFRKQLAASITAEEQRELFELSNQPEQEALLRQLMDDTWNDLEATRPRPVLRRPLVQRNWFRAAAAAALLVAATGTWYWFSGPSQTVTERPLATTIVKDLPPGKEGAILTLADGRQILLDTVKNGTRLQVNGIAMEMKNGQLLYSDGNAGAAAFHTMSTPRGRQFQLQLPDGTQVWLNAASSIRYPSAFSGNERKVEITGEAYLNVAKDPRRPFRVVTAAQMATVTGTQFNVNAYADEMQERTTLVEGGVNVNDISSNAISQLHPGEQALLKDGRLTVRKVDLEEVTAWKNGLFHFVNADIPAVMRQLQRWYNIEVSYEGKIPQREFQGKMQRDLNLSELLTLLEKADVHFRLEENRKLVVTP
ncbi:MAG: FecR family protein [Pseudobacter sp.]|uniref:FecR family protein n=1 Tax=Pseudobacter sp. TaxID=2045420 RepID=UPI003F817DA4